VGWRGPNSACRLALAFLFFKKIFLNPTQKQYLANLEAFSRKMPKIKVVEKFKLNNFHLGLNSKF